MSSQSEYTGQPNYYQPNYPSQPNQYAIPLTNTQSTAPSSPRADLPPLPLPHYDHIPTMGGNPLNSIQMYLENRKKDAEILNLHARLLALEASNKYYQNQYQNSLKEIKRTEDSKERLYERYRYECTARRVVIKHFREYRNNPRICEHYQTSSNCRFGSRCKFIHIKLSDLKCSRCNKMYCNPNISRYCNCRRHQTSSSSSSSSKRSSSVSSSSSSKRIKSE